MVWEFQGKDLGGRGDEGALRGMTQGVEATVKGLQYFNSQALVPSFTRPGIALYFCSDSSVIH